jgi:hypothetical protein
MRPDFRLGRSGEIFSVLNEKTGQNEGVKSINSHPYE